MQKFSSQINKTQHPVQALVFTKISKIAPSRDVINQKVVSEREESIELHVVAPSKAENSIEIHAALPVSVCFYALLYFVVSKTIINNCAIL
jgi:hypothetical protein